MKRTIKWLVNKCLSDHVLIVPNHANVKAMIEKELPGYHLHKNRSKNDHQTATSSPEQNSGEISEGKVKSDMIPPVEEKGEQLRLDA